MHARCRARKERDRERKKMKTSSVMKKRTDLACDREMRRMEERIQRNSLKDFCLKMRA